MAKVSAKALAAIKAKDKAIMNQSASAPKKAMLPDGSARPTTYSDMQNTGLKMADAINILSAGVKPVDEMNAKLGTNVMTDNKLGMKATQAKALANKKR